MSDPEEAKLKKRRRKQKLSSHIPQGTEILQFNNSKEAIKTTMSKYTTKTLTFVGRELGGLVGGALTPYVSGESPTKELYGYNRAP